MNGKLWKFLQYSSITVLIGGGVILFLNLPKERLPDGGWQTTFPSPTIQLTLSIISISLLLLFIFATYVIKEGEVSIRAAKRALTFAIGFGIFYMILQWI